MSQLTDLFRRDFPDYAAGKSDDELLGFISTQRPDLIAYDPEARARLAQLQGAGGPEAEGALMTGAREFAENIVPAAATAAGGLAAGAAASETGPGAIPAAIAGATAAGAGARKLQDKVEAMLMGDEGVARLRAQEQSNREAHPIAANIGSFIGQIPSMFGAGGLGKKATGLAADATEGLAERLIENAAAGAMLSGSNAAQAKVSGQPGSDDVSIPGEIIKGAVTMGPLGFIKAAKSVLGAIGWKAPTDAAVMGINNALYDHFVRGKEIDPKALAEQIGTDIPGFMLMNGLSAVLHLPFAPTKDGKITSPEAGKAKEPEPTPAQPEGPAESINPAATYQPRAPQDQSSAELTAAGYTPTYGPTGNLIHLLDPNGKEVELPTKGAPNANQEPSPVEEVRSESQAAAPAEEVANGGTAEVQSTPEAVAQNVPPVAQPAAEPAAATPAPQPAPTAPAAQPTPFQARLEAARRSAAVVSDDEMSDAADAYLNSQQPSPTQGPATPPAKGPNTSPGVGEQPSLVGPETAARPWQRLQGNPEELIGTVGFDSAQLAKRGAKGETGRQNAEAYTETGDEAELYKDKRADSRAPNLTRKLGVFQADDGSHVMVSTVFYNKGRNYVTTFDAEGKPKNVQYKNLEGYKLIGAIKRSADLPPIRDTAVTYSPDQWKGIHETLLDMRQKARGTFSGQAEALAKSGVADREAEKEEGGEAGERSDEIDAIKDNVAASEVHEVKGFTADHARAIYDAVAHLSSDRAEWELDFTDAIGKNRRAFAAIERAVKGLVKAGYDPRQAFDAVKVSIYESVHQQKVAGGGREAFAESFLQGARRKADEGAQPVRADAGRAAAATSAERGGQGVGEGASKRAEIENAAARVNTNPTEAQKQAGNYAKGHVTIDGLDVTIENPKGSTRSGTDANGKPWSVEMPAHYGYVKGTEGHDGDHVDVYIGDHPEAPKVWVVDQIDPKTKKFDEHKALIGFTSREDAVRHYAAGFSDGSGPARLGAITEMPKEDFVDWVHEGETDKPLSYGKKFQGSSVARYSERIPTAEREAYETRVGEMWNAGLDSLRTNGVSVSAIEGAAEGGVWHPRQIQLVVSDLTRPTRDNVVLLFHEAGHEVFSRLGLPPAVEDAFHRAISKLAAPQGQRFTLPEGVDPAKVRPEEVLVERAGRALVAEGFNPAESQSIAQRLVRYAKRIYYRLAMAVQRGLLGDQHVNPELAERYFQERVRAFLAGDDAMGMLSFLGGPKLTTGERGGTFRPAGGHGALDMAYDFTAGEPQYREALPETMAAMAFNRDVATRFSVREKENAGPAFETVRDPHVISRDLNSPDKVKEDVAAYNALHDMHSMAHRVFDSIPNNPKLTFEQFLSAFTNADTPAGEKIRLRNEELKANGFQPVDETARPTDLLSEASKMQAADKALHYGWGLREYWSDRAEEAERFLRTAADRQNRLTVRLFDLAKRYTDMDLQFANAKSELRDLHEEFADDLKQGVRSARRIGTLTQVISQIDQRLIDPLATAKQYERVIEKLYSRYTKDNKGSFVDLLQRVAGLNIDWDKTPSKQAAEQIALAGLTDPNLSPLENKALAAIAVAFAKRNAHVLEFLNLARSDAFDERTKLNGILKDALDGTKEGITRAKELARKLPKLAVTADRLLTRLEKLQDESHAHLDETRRHQMFLDFHREAVPLLRSQMIQLERMIGAKTQSWEPNNGAEYYVAPKPGATEEQVMANKRVFKLAGVEGNEDVLKHIQQNNAWLDSVPANQRGAFWNTVKEMTSKLEQTAAIAGHELVIKSSFVNYFFGSITDKLDSLGLPSGRAAAMRMRRYLAERHAAHGDADNLGVRWKAAESKAMDVLDMRSAGAEKFQEMFLQSALSFAEKNPDIRAAFKGNKEAFDALLPRLRRYLESDHDTAKALERPGAWTALEKYYRETYTNMEWVNDLRKKLGVKILEQGPDEFKIEREPIGATFYTALRRISKDAVRMYQNMRELGWLGTEADGKFKAAEVAQQYDQDPGTLAARAQRRFTADVWREFVRPLVETDGRSNFYGPKRTDGLSPLALRENVMKAAEASRNDPVKFAEHLYDLEAGNGTAESRSEFVGKTLQAFQEFFDSIHNTQADYDDAVRQGIPTPPRLLQDARISESWPGAWLDYQTYGRHEMHQMATQLASQAAFGRDLKGMRQDLQTTVNELTRKVSKFEGIVKRVQDTNPGVKGRKLDTLIKAECQRQGESYMALSQASRNLKMAKNEQSQFENLMKLQGGLALELRPFMELVSAAAGATVQGPGTALVHFGNYGQAFQKLGLGATAMRVLGSSLKSLAAENVGTFAQLFHGQIAWNADRNARRVRVGLVDPDAKRRFQETVAAFTNDATAATNPFSRGVFKFARGLRAATSSGIGRAQDGADNIYTTLKPHALFTQLAQHIVASIQDGWTSGFEDAIERAVDFYKDPANAAEFADPAHRFEKFTDLGYSKGFLGIGNDERAFKYFYAALNRYGMGLEQMARDVIERRKTNPKAPAITDEQFRVLASLAQDEVTLDATLANRPSSIYTNPVIRLASPLLGWSVAKTHDNWEAWRNPNMTQTSQNAFKAFATGLLPYAALVPAGIALGLMRDAYSSTVLNKKANREDPTSFAGMVDSLSWVGNLGLAGDVFNSLLNRDTQRPFDVDNRVFFMSSLLNAKNALQNWYEQGSADYATVYRPLMQSLGGAGYIQYAQILNHALALDNAEARVTARINAQNLLRVAGRELHLDVRATTGGEVMSTPIRPFIGQMTLAAYANDPVAFRDAYRNALAVAREDKQADPEKYVAQKFAGYNPLRSVFKTEPSETDLARIRAVLGDAGKADVNSALLHFNTYATQIGCRPDYGRPDKAQSFSLPKLPAMNLNDVRRIAAGY